MSMMEAGSVAVVVGYRNGAAQVIASKMAAAHPGVKVRAFLENAPGASSTAGGEVSFPAGVEVTYKAIDAVTSGDLAGVAATLISLDKGVEFETGADLTNYLPLPILLEKLATTSSAVLVAAYANDTSGRGKSGGLPINLFSKGVNPKELVDAARAGGSGGRKPWVLVQHGRLFGSSSPAVAGGARPLPFIGGPLQTPVVEESYAKQNLLLSLGSSLARNPAAATMRGTLAEAMVRTAERVSAIADFSVVSLEGQAPSEGDWEQQLEGLDTRGGVTVFEKVLGANERVDLPVLQDWLANDFGAGLSTLAISRVLNSPKPAIVATTNLGSDIIWQFVEKDLRVTVSGRWCIQLDTKEGTIKILRVDATGQMLTEPLPGEEELLQRFSAAINRLVYSKKLSKRR